MQQVTSLHCYVGVHRHVTWNIKDNLSSSFCLVLPFFMYGMLQISDYWTDFVRLHDKALIHTHQGAHDGNTRRGTPQIISCPGCTCPPEAHSTSPEEPSGRMAGRSSKQSFLRTKPPCHVSPRAVTGPATLLSASSRKLITSHQEHLQAMPLTLSYRVVFGCFARGSFYGTRPASDR